MSEHFISGSFAKFALINNNIYVQGIQDYAIKAINLKC